MSEVALSIGGRSYKVACAAGEEAHVGRLGEAIDAKLQSMAQLSPQESQNLLFAALLLADELHDLRNANTAAQDEAAQAREALDPLRAEIERLRAQADEAGAHQALLDEMRGELAGLREAEAELRRELDAANIVEREMRAQLEAAQSAPASGVPLGGPDLAPALERFAELLETCADKLEGKPANA